MKAIYTRYHGPTDYKGSRVTAADNDGNRVTVSWACELNTDANHAAAVRALCAKMDWHGELIGADLLDAGRSIGTVWVWLKSADRLTV